jgi:hypothetical protein
MKPLAAWLFALAVLAFTVGLWFHAPAACATAWASGYTRELGCPGFVLASGRFDGADHEIADQGFFAIGGAGVSLRPQTPAWFQAKELRGRDGMELVLRPIRCRELQKLEGR